MSGVLSVEARSLCCVVGQLVSACHVTFFRSGELSVLQVSGRVAPRRLPIP